MRQPSDCCVECHFEWEEEHAFPFLPPGARRLIEAEHRRLLRTKDCEETIRHSQREVAIFRRYVPAPILSRILDDHGALDEALTRGVWPDD